MNSLSQGSTSAADKHRLDSIAAPDYYHDTASSASCSYEQDGFHTSPSHGQDSGKKKSMWEKLYRSRTASQVEFAMHDPPQPMSAHHPDRFCISPQRDSFSGGDPASMMSNLSMDEALQPAGRPRPFMRRHSNSNLSLEDSAGENLTPKRLGHRTMSSSGGGLQLPPRAHSDIIGTPMSSSGGGLQLPPRAHSDIIGTPGAEGRTPSGNGRNTPSPYSTLTTDEESHSSFQLGSQTGKNANSSPTPSPHIDSFQNTSNKAWQIQYLQNTAEIGAEVPLQCGVAGHWRKNVDDSDTGAVFEELLDMPKLQRLARQRTHALEIKETADHIELLWRVRLNGGREIVKAEKYAKEGSIVEGVRKDGREGQQRGFVSFKEGVINVRAVQGDPYAALFHDKLRLSTRGNRLKIEHKLQLLIQGVQPVKYTTIWNRVREDGQPTLKTSKSATQLAFESPPNGNT